MIDRLLPHDAASEAAILGAVLLEKVCFDEARPAIKGPEFFYCQPNQAIWAEMCRMADKGMTIDAVTLYQRLRDGGTLEDAGGFAYVQNLPEQCGSTSGLENYLETVREHYLRRRMIMAFTRQVQELYDSRTPADTLLEQAHAELEALYHTDSNLVDSKTASGLMIDDLEWRFNLQGALTGVPTGFKRFDALTDGLQYGDQTIIGSRPSIGKTAIALNVFFHATVHCQIPSLFVSLEMSITSLMRRMASTATSIEAKALRGGTFCESDFKKLMVFRLTTSKAPMWFYDGVCGVDIARLSSEIRRACRRYGIKLVVIDYLQRILPDERHEKRTYEVGGVSTRLTGLADRTEAAFLTLAQLNRDSEKDKKPRPPRLSDLGDSKQIEQDADVVGLLHRDRYKNQNDAYLIVAKNRDGETGICNLKFDGAHSRFEDSIL